MPTRPAVAYLRASTSKQKLSCDDQLHAIEAYCARAGLRLIRVFRDDGISGSKGRAGRAAWNEVLEYIESGSLKGGVVAVWSLDRWSRDFRAGLTAAWIAGDYDVELHSTDGGRQDLDTLEGQIMGAMALALAQRETRERARRVRERKREHAQKGYWTTRPPYGYLTVGDRGRKSLVADPRMAPIVCEIFNRYDAGESLSQIATNLNERRVQTKTGQSWVQATLRGILRNPTYSGMIACGEGRVPGVVELFVPPALAERCRVRASRTKDPNGPRTKYPLTGLVTCALCGQRMYVHTWNRWSGGKRRVYRCRGRINGTCGSPAVIDVDAIEAGVIAWWRSLCDGDAIDTLAREAVAAEHAEMIRAQEKRRPFLDQLADLDRREQRLVDAIAEAGISPVIRRRLDEVRAARARVEAELGDDGDVEPFDIEAAVERLGELVRAAATAGALRPFLDCISVTPDRTVTLDAFGRRVNIGV